MPDPPYHFVDTSAKYFNFGPQTKSEKKADGSPTDETIAQFGNPFAAMPSFHVGWSTWSVLALWPLVRRKWVKALLALYPLTVIFCIVVTANHWILDAVGGWVVLGLGYAGALGIEALGRAFRAGRPRAAGADTASPRSGA
jgi:membrane-associated phospholipid phosphatase